MAFAAARMILKDKRRKSKEDFAPPPRQRSKVDLYILFIYNLCFVSFILKCVTNFCSFLCVIRGNIHNI